MLANSTQLYCHATVTTMIDCKTSLQHLHVLYVETQYDICEESVTILYSRSDKICQTYTECQIRSWIVHMRTSVVARSTCARILEAMFTCQQAVPVHHTSVSIRYSVVQARALPVQAVNQRKHHFSMIDGLYSWYTLLWLQLHTASDIAMWQYETVRSASSGAH